MDKKLTADLNVVANSNLEIEYLNGDLNIIQKLDDEPNDVGGLTSAQLKAKFDESGNIIKEYINKTLIPAVLSEDATEEGRKEAETQRETNEAARQAHETARQTAETERVTAEQGRISAERERAAAESSRAEAEASRQAAEQARADENTGIVARATAQANAAAGSAENAAASASTAQEGASTASSQAAAAGRFASSASASEAAAAGSAASASNASMSAQSWAVGGTGTRDGEDTNNAKYWSEQAKSAAGGDFATKAEAQGYVDTHNQSAEAHSDIRAALATHAAQHATGGSDPITPEQIGAASGSASKVVVVKTSGWYRVLTISPSDASGILSIDHQYYSSYASSLKFLVSLDEYVSSLKCIDFPNTQMPVTNARLVKTANSFAVDIFYSVNSANRIRATFVNTGYYKAETVDFEFIAADDTLPAGETLIMPMEYLNPPMAVGVEYRTTERYQGKPVYKQLLNLGSAPAQGTVKTIDVPQNSTDQQLVQAMLTYYGIDFPKYKADGTLSMCIYVAPGSKKIYVYSPGEDRSANGRIEALLKYTKSTD